MTKITMSLKELSEAFQQSAADETLSVAERRLAAQNSVLAAHMQRIEGTAARSLIALGGPEGRVTKLERLIADAMKTTPEKPVTPAAPAAPSAPVPVKGEIVPAPEEENNEDGDVAKFLAEAAAEERAARATAGAPPPKPTLGLVDNKESA